MEMYLFLTIFCLVQLSWAQNSTESINAFLEIKDEKIHKVPTNFMQVKENIPSYSWTKIEWPTTTWPSNVVIGGMDTTNYCKTVHVGRAMYMGNLLPAKICSSNGIAYVSYNGVEVRLYESEVLSSDYAVWKPIKEPRIPTSALPIGYTAQGEVLYLGRWFVNTFLTPGKIEANSKILSLTYEGKAYNSSIYEILVLKADDDL